MCLVRVQGQRVTGHLNALHILLAAFIFTDIYTKFLRAHLDIVALHIV